MLTNLLNSINPIWNLDNWDTTGTVTIDENGLNTSTGAGENNYARSKWYLTGDFDIQAYVIITNRSAVKTHWTSMWISRQSDDTCFAAHRNTWDPTAGWSPQWRGWDSCSPVTTMGGVGETTYAWHNISRIVRISSTIYTYVKHFDQPGWPNSSWILTGQDNSFASGVPGNADCNVTLGAQSRDSNPSGEVTWRYLDVVSGTVVNP